MNQNNVKNIIREGTEKEWGKMKKIGKTYNRAK